ncbi:MAG: hypothetical protein H6510_11995 [Acidobacteria bacterium]|nr:hypothetical protein [Acidobacteriota bacterium]
MRISLALLLLVSACATKKSDSELFAEERPTIDLSASANMGYTPLRVDFTAYLETPDRTVEREITEVKWLIRGPSGYEREITSDAQNFQEEEGNQRSFFYLEYDFNLPGKYYVQLVLNDGEYASKKIPVSVMDMPSENRRRF